MENRAANNRFLWLAVGLAAGLCIAYLWPAEPALAIATDRSAEYAVATTPVTFGRAQGIFAFDFLTGRLAGAVLNPSFRKFTHFYLRDINADFKVPQGVRPQYAIVAGEAALPNVGPASMAQGVIYVAELKSGVVKCYGFNFNENNQVSAPLPLIYLDEFRFREAAP